MVRLRLSYFDFDGGRGEPARIALRLAAIPFEDHRIPVAEWAVVRESTPLHAVPVLEVDGVEITQSNAINRFVGKLARLYPDDPWQAALCDELMDALEDIMSRVVATFGMPDPEALRAARQRLVDGPLPLYLGWAQDRLRAAGGKYFCDGRLTVADLKAHIWVRHLRSGLLDHIPPDLPDRIAPDLVAHSTRVQQEAVGGAS